MSDSRYGIWDKTMDIYAPPGTVVVYTGKGGYPIDTEQADRVLKRFETYVVRQTDVGNSYTSVYLYGYEQGFNSCMFVEQGRE
jgi:hypothetical protein